MSMYRTHQLDGGTCHAVAAFDNTFAIPRHALGTDRAGHDYIRCRFLNLRFQANYGTRFSLFIFRLGVNDAPRTSVNTGFELIFKLMTRTGKEKNRLRVNCRAEAALCKHMIILLFGGGSQNISWHCQLARASHACPLVRRASHRMQGIVIVQHKM
jgi:hypothetical protein